MDSLPRRRMALMLSRRRCSSSIVLAVSSRNTEVCSSGSRSRRIPRIREAVSWSFASAVTLCFTLLTLLRSMRLLLVAA